MTQRILIMGLPGAGKTTLAEALQRKIWEAGRTCSWFNADRIRQYYNDWDFSEEGRMRQSKRMRNLADLSTNDYVIADYVAPTDELRDVYGADWLIWVDTISEGRYADTNKLFQEPFGYDFRVNTQDAEFWSERIFNMIDSGTIKSFDWKKPTVQMLGRWQPWHDGHRALFERAVAKTGQVCIMVRDVFDEKNPFTFEQVQRFIHRDLDPLYQGTFQVHAVPNITNITYGRDVGYSITQEVFDEDTHAISATNIRKELGL